MSKDWNIRSIGCRSSASTQVVEDVDTQESAGDPKAGRDEAEGLSGLPLPTVAAIC